MTWIHSHTHRIALSLIHTLCFTHSFADLLCLSPSVQFSYFSREMNIKIGLNKNYIMKGKSRGKKCMHIAGPSRLRAADTNKGCSGFDSMRQASTAQRGWPFTACQLAPLQEASTKSRRMWDSHKGDDSDILTSNLRHAGTKRQAHTSLSCSCPPPSLQRDSSWPVQLSVTLMRLLLYGQFLRPSRAPPLSLFIVFKTTT